MASAFSHIAIPIGLRLAAGSKKISWRLLLVGLFLSVAPDLDAIAFYFGIPYESQWGHRGFTHSILFAACFAWLPMFFHRYLKSSRVVVYLLSFVSMLSHGILDAMTTGGLGVAFVWPFNDERYFFPWRVIEVSPISVNRFFTERGISVIMSEVGYIWIPTLAIAVLFFGVRLLRDKRKNQVRQQ